MSAGKEPWLSIPLADYEGHMEAVGQATALRRLFSEVYESVEPARLAVLGCTAGADFEEIDPAVTQVAIGVDINPEYLKAAEQRLAALGRRVHLICGDVLTVSLPTAPIDLIHAALLLEYVDLTLFLRRVRQWLGLDGYLSLISQEPLAGVAAVSRSSYTSLGVLAGRMALRSSGEIDLACAKEGLALVSRQKLELPSGKILTHSIFKAAPKQARSKPEGFLSRCSRDAKNSRRGPPFRAERREIGTRFISARKTVRILECPVRQALSRQHENQLSTFGHGRSPTRGGHRLLRSAARCGPRPEIPGALAPKS